MSAWEMTPDLRGNPNLIRVFAGAARDDEQGCPMAAAAKARPGVRSARPEPYRRSALEDFPLQPVMQVLDAVEHHGTDVETALARLETEGSRGRYVHPGLVRWTRHAAVQYLDAFPVTWDQEPAGGSGGARLRPVADSWVHRWPPRPDAAGPLGTPVYELCAWGRRYASPDGRVRELRLLRMGVAGARARDPAEVAVAGFVVATGSPARDPNPWSSAFRLRHGEPLPERVRVLEVGCVDGSSTVLFEGSAQDAVACYRARGQPRLRASVDGSRRHSGRACATCKLTSACSAIPSVPGLFGIDDNTRPRRLLSVTDARRYRVCPAQEHLRRLNLPSPRDVEYGPEAVRGLAVHAWLQHLHARHPPRACGDRELVAAPADWDAAAWALPEGEAALASQLLAAHALVCPLQRVTAGDEVRVEPTVAAYDPAANVVAIAQPDLLYQDQGAWVWRETKTTRSVAPPREDLLEVYPQLALAVALLSEGVLGGTAAGTRVELEVLRPTGPDLDMIDPHDPARQARARAVLHALAAEWHADTTFTARPGEHCARCQVAAWCPDAAT